jgi:biopolymer transport protein ExbD
VTPLVDIMLVLLVIFGRDAAPPPQVPVELPLARRGDPARR